jgi:anoctamin-10/anoctamin-7
VTGAPLLYFPRQEFYFRISVSVSVISTLIMIVLAVVTGIFILRIILSSTSALNVGGTNLGSIITAIINAVQIQVLNAIYQTVAVYLNDYENHRTDTQYEDALIAKVFIFQFVNSFSSLFYIAFVKPYIPDIDPCVVGCMQELSTSLGTIFLTRLATGSILSVAIPYYAQKARIKKESKGADPKDLSDVELAFMQEEYHVMLGTFQLYAALAIQFGYTTMFIAAYPLATVMAFVSNYVGE